MVRMTALFGKKVLDENSRSRLPRCHVDGDEAVDANVATTLGYQFEPVDMWPHTTMPFVVSMCESNNALERSGNCVSAHPARLKRASHTSNSFMVSVPIWPRLLLEAVPEEGCVAPVS